MPALVTHSEDHQIVPFADAGPLSAKLFKNGTLKAILPATKAIPPFG